MRFEIKNVAKVREATIVLDGITVIAGANGSGKSTISRALNTFVNVFYRLDDLIREARLRSLELLFRRAEWRSLPISFSSFFYRLGQERLLDWNFLQNSEDVYHLLMRATRRYAAQKMRLNSDDEEIEIKRKFLEDYNNLLPEIEKIRQRSDEEYADIVLFNAFERAFKGQLTSLYTKRETLPELSLMASDRETRLAFSENGLAERSGLLGQRSQSIFYLEPVHLVDNVDSYSMEFRQGSNHMWHMLVDSADDVLTYEEMQGRIRVKECVQNIIRTIRGQFKVEKQGLKFKDIDFEDVVELQNVASGAKSMATIVQALEMGNIRPESILVIDEPESNLHPEWQVRFAEFLILLVKQLNIKLLLNTHSPYFLMAIEKFTQREGLENQFNAYRMEQEDESPLFVAKRVNKNIDVVYETMAAPFDELRFSR